jgi:hypothetical protein
MKQSCNKKEKNRTNIYFLREKARKKNRKTLKQLETFLKHLKIEKK